MLSFTHIHTYTDKYLLSSILWNSNQDEYVMSKGKGKVKLSLCLTKHHTMKAYWGSGGIAPCILQPQH
jgi:hypothetical protein